MFLNSNQNLNCKKHWNKNPIRTAVNLMAKPEEVKSDTDSYQSLRLDLLSKQRERLLAIADSLMISPEKKRLIDDTRTSIGDLIAQIEGTSNDAERTDLQNQINDQIDTITLRIASLNGLSPEMHYKRLEELRVDFDKWLSDLRMEVKTKPDYLDRLPKGNKEVLEVKKEAYRLVGEGGVKAIPKWEKEVKDYNSQLEVEQSNIANLSNERSQNVNYFYEASLAERMAKKIAEQIETLDIEEVSGDLIAQIKAKSAQEIESMLQGTEQLKDGPVSQLFELMNGWTGISVSSANIIADLEHFSIVILPEELEMKLVKLDELNEDIRLACSKTEALKKKIAARQFAIKHLTEKSEAIKTTDEIEREFEQFYADQKGQLESGSIDLVENGLKVGAMTQALNGIDIDKPKQRKPENLDSLLAGFSIFSKKAIPKERVENALTKKSPELTEKIMKIARKNNSLYFVSRQDFDSFFNGQTVFAGKKVDNLKGGKGAFFNGSMIIVFDEENLDGSELLKVMTHESIHGAMHKEEFITKNLLSIMLYGDLEKSQAGMDSALAGNTLGAKVIQEFLRDKGSDFSDWASKRVKAGKYTEYDFRLVLQDEALAGEVLEEAITMYLTSFALNGSNGEYSNPPYFYILHQFHQTDNGKDFFDSFLADIGSEAVEDTVILGFDSETKEKEDEDLNDSHLSTDSLTQQVESIRKLAITAREKMVKLYNVQDFRLIFTDIENDMMHYEKQIRDMVQYENEEVDIIPIGTLQQFSNELKAYEKRIKEEILDKLNAEETKINALDAINDGLSPLHRIYKNTSLVSYDDIIKVFQDVWAYLKERKELRRDRISAQVATEVATTDRMKSYFDGIQQAVQNRDMGKWKEIYTNKDPSSIDGYLKASKDPNQFKALCEIKASTVGDFSFRNPDVLEGIRRISGKDIKNHYQAKIVWDSMFGTGDAAGLERSNKGTRSSKVSEGEAFGVQHADRLGKEWMGMITTLQSGNWIDKPRFEGYLRYALKAGKSYTKQVYWVMAKAYMLGILDHTDVIDMAGTLMVQVPQLEHFNTMLANHEAGVKYEEGCDYDSDGNEIPGTRRMMTEIEWIASFQLFDKDGSKSLDGKYGDNAEVRGRRQDQWRLYDKWLITKVNKRKNVKERMTKIVRAFDNVDHDYAQDIWWEMSESDFASIFKERAGVAAMLTDSGIANIYGQFLVDCLYWDNTELNAKYKLWFATDRMLNEDHFQREDNGEFKMIQGRRQKDGTKVIIDEEKLSTKSAPMFAQGFTMGQFRNLGYQAYKFGMKYSSLDYSRAYMLAAVCKLKLGWVEANVVRRELSEKGWMQCLSVFNDLMNNNNSFGVDYANLPTPPISHQATYTRGGIPSSMKADLGSVGVGYPTW